MEKFIQIEGGLHNVKGIYTAGVSCGIKKGNKDLAIIYSEKESQAAGVFTTNIFRAAPVLITQKHLQNSRAQAIVVNSGNANACTGSMGLKNAQEMAKITAKALHLAEGNVLVASTGIIGTSLPMDKIREGISSAAGQLTHIGPDKAAEAIMTTDTFPKSMAVEMNLSGKKSYLAGIAKGAGMIKPNMATMLSFLYTDASIDAQLLKKALKEAVDQSFNTITIDGDTSTNDMVILLSNGLAKNNTLTEENTDFFIFQEALHFVTRQLARMIIKDGEGATKFIEIHVTGARNKKEAKHIAYTIAESPLVKTAFFGERCLWGRIIAAIGYSGVSLKPEKIDLFYGPIQIISEGISTGREIEVAKILKQKEIKITVNLNIGQEEAKILTCDLSKEYIAINMGYS